MRASYAVILAVVCLQLASGETPKELNSRGVKLFMQGQYSEAERTYREALNRYKSEPVLDVNGYAATLNNLAGCLQTDGKIKEARELLNEVIALDPQILGEDNIVTHALNSLALLEQADSQYPKAIAHLQRALTRSPVPDETKAGTLHNLGSMYYDLGQHKKARETFEASLEMHKQAGRTLQTPPTLAFLARLAWRSGDAKRAIDLLEQSLALRVATYGPNHPLVALSHNDVAELYRDTKRYDEAVASFEEALRILRQSVGKDHHYVSLVLFQYGELRRLQDRNPEAIEFYEHSIRILESTFGPGHVRLATVLNSAAIAAAKMKRKNQANDYSTRARTIERNQAPYGRHTVDVSAFTNNPR